MGCFAISLAGPGMTMVLQPGTTEQERERIPTRLSFQGRLKNGKCINRTLINHLTLFRKYWKVKKFSQQGGIRIKNQSFTELPDKALFSRVPPSVLCYGE